MNFKFDTGTIVVIASIVIFYLALGYRNIMKARRESNKANIALRKAQKEGRQVGIPSKPEEKLWLQVRSWWLTGISIGLVMIGLAVNSLSIGLPTSLVELWYLPVASGILLLAFAIK